MGSCSAFGHPINSKKTFMARRTQHSGFCDPLIESSPNWKLGADARLGVVNGVIGKSPHLLAAGSSS
jgi:hypothetical protein